MTDDLPHSALCTQEEALAAGLDSDQAFEEIFSQGAEHEKEGLRLITSASDRVRSYLDRALIADVHEQLVAYRDWRQKDRAPGDYSFRLTTRQWPLVALLEPYDEYDVATRDRSVFATRRREEALSYVAGYRRDLHELDQFPSAVQEAVDSIDDIPLLPDDIRHCTAQIAVIRGRQGVQGLKGTSNVEQTSGEFSASMSIQKADRKAELRELRRINHRRHLH